MLGKANNTRSPKKKVFNKCKSILLQDNVVRSVNNDQVLCISFQEDSKVFPPHPPEDQPGCQRDKSSKNMASTISKLIHILQWISDKYEKECSLVYNKTEWCS